VSQTTSLPIHHVALRVADPEASLAFYSGVLGLPELRRMDEAGRVRSIWVQAGPCALMLERQIKGGGPATGSGHVLVLEVVDLDDWIGRLAQAGHRPLDRTESTVFFADPDGHRIGLTVFPRDRMVAPSGGR
jgi:catechol 2,3-dioxygenase-like lactoylglutathione lyase family enzyme